MDDRTKYKNARAFVVLLAAFITQMLNLKYKREMLDSMLTLLFVIVIFTIISTVAIKLFDKIKKMEDKSKVIEPNVPGEDEVSEQNE